MPNYLFSNPKTGEIKEIFFHMKEEKKFIDKKGVEWKREFSVPFANFDTKAIDPFSQKQFVERTAKYKGGTMGELWDESKTLAMKRQEITGGDDKILKTAKKQYSKARKDKPFPRAIKDVEKSSSDTKYV